MKLGCGDCKPLVKKAFVNIYLVLVKEKVPEQEVSSSILKTFSFMDEGVATRFFNKIKKIQAELISQELNQQITKQYQKIPVNFHLIQSVEIKELGKLNVNLDCLEFKSEEV
jgi:hypothetical protein